jgi:hypothetical protein
LERLSSAHDISEQHYWKLKFLIHVHDAFKVEAAPGHSHESLAREYASALMDDPDLLNIIEYHDLNFDLWKQFSRTGTFQEDQLRDKLGSIGDVDLLLMFTIIYGSTKGKDLDKLGWFICEVRKYRKTTVDESWLIFSAEDYRER